VITGSDTVVGERHAKTESLGGTPSLRRRPAPRTVLAVAALGSAVAFVDATIVNIALPSIQRSFPGTSIASISWILNAYNIVFAAFLLPAGRIADLLGRRRVFMLGIELFTAASLLCAIAPSIGLLVAFRVVQALGAALLVPASLALVLHAFPPEHRSHGVALLAAVAAAAAGLGPSLGGVLVALADWRLVFIVNLPIGIAAVVLSRRLLVESRAAERRRLPDLLGALTFALAVGALVLAIVKGQDWGWASAQVIGALLVAIVLGAVFARRCMWHRSPIVDLRLLRIRSLSAANGMTTVAAAGYYGYTLANVLFLTYVWHYSVLKAGLSLTPGPFVAAAVAGPTSKLVLRIGHRPVLVAGGLIWGSAVLWFVERVGASPAFLSEWLPGMVLLGMGAGTLFPNLTSAAVAAAPEERFATATGMNSVARQVGAAFGVALVVAIIGTPSPSQVMTAFDNAWTFGSLCLFAAGIGCLLVGRVSFAASPSLGAAARTVLLSSDAQPAVSHSPRARRAISALQQAPPTRAETPDEFFARVPLFGEVEPALRSELAKRTETVHVAAGHWLFRQGDAADAMYIVRAGRLEAIDEATSTVLRELGRGDAVGELGLLTGSPRAAGVRAARATDLIAIDSEDFDEFLQSSPALSLALTRSLAEQLRETGAPAPRARPRPTTVAIVRLTRHAPHDTVGHDLARALSAYLSPVLLDGSEIHEPAESEAPAAAYGPLLDRAEAAHDLVLLDGGTVGSGRPWGKFCLQQADRILALTYADQKPDPGLVGPELRGCDLVQLDTSPGTGAVARWAELLDPIESHVIRTTSWDEDIGRMARRLSGRSVGIVLSGGGARAFSHIGVLEELMAAGITIDRVMGVSMGAFVGALFAMGLDADEMDECCFEEWVQRRPLSDYTIPRHSLIRGERFRSMLQRTFGQTMIEELPLSYMSGCTELRSGRLVLARHGSLFEAVGFSICLPIIAPPQVRGRELFIDGSLVDNLPVGAMAELGEGPVIAVDVKATFERPPTMKNGSGGSADRTRIDVDGAETARTPSLGETLTRVLLLGSAKTSEAASRHANMVIRPRVEGVGLLEFHQLDAARRAGRVAAREVLERGSTISFV
jgi:EmrB/QacA subfamily drug resistance transporter